MKVYKFMAEIADRRTKQYKALESILDILTFKYGKESKEVEEFFNKNVVDVLTEECSVSFIE
jgi:predicted metal-dependent TIM-barrel fold hydrolase